MTTARFEPSGPLRGWLRPPSDKSISHRAALIAAMGEGETPIEGYLDAADTRSTLDAVRAVGAEVHEEELGKEGGVAGARGLQLRIHGVGLRNPRSAKIDVGNAGTLLRLLPGWLAGQSRGEWSIDGDESIRLLLIRICGARHRESTATSRSVGAPSTGSRSRCERWALI